jgi:lactoylglutathione lyase
MKNRPFKILGLQQVAIGSENKEQLKVLWSDMLGLEYKSSFRFRERKC